MLPLRIYTNILMCMSMLKCNTSSTGYIQSDNRKRLNVSVKYRRIRSIACKDHFHRDIMAYQGKIVAVSTVNPVLRTSYISYCAVHYMPISGKSIQMRNMLKIQISFNDIMSSENELVIRNLAMFLFYAFKRPIMQYNLNF